MKRWSTETIAWSTALSLHAVLLAWPTGDREHGPRRQFIELTYDFAPASTPPEATPPEPLPPEPLPPEPPPPKPPPPKPPSPKPRKLEAAPPPDPPPTPDPTATVEASSPPAVGTTPPIDAVASPVTVPLASHVTGSTTNRVSTATPVTSTASPSPPQPRPGASTSDGRGELKAYGKSIHHAVSRQRRYPFAARRLGLTGQAKVRVVVDRRGALQQPATIVQSSGHEVLDREALAAVQRSSPFPPLPAATDRQTATFVIPIVFRLSVAGRGQ